MLELIQKALEWLKIKDHPKKSDVIFLFGSTSYDIPKKGFKLWKQKYADLILCNGLDTHDPEWKWTKPCAEVYAEYLLKIGVPQKAIFKQNKSINTLEDVLFGVGLLKKLNLAYESLILVARPFHQRRVFATFKKHFPNIKVYNYPADDKPLSKMTEKQLVKIGQKCLEEYRKLIEYAKKGDLEKQEATGEIRDIFSQLENQLRSSIKLKN